MFGSWRCKSTECSDSTENKRGFFPEKEDYGIQNFFRTHLLPQGHSHKQHTQSVYICHFIYFYLQEELKQKFKGVFFSPLNMNHSSKTNLTTEISKVKGSMHGNPRAKAEGEGCSGRPTDDDAVVHLLGTATPPRKASTRTL